MSQALLCRIFFKHRPQTVLIKDCDRQGISFGMDGKVLLMLEKGNLQRQNHLGVTEGCVYVTHQSLCAYSI